MNKPALPKRERHHTKRSLQEIFRSLHKSLAKNAKADEDDHLSRLLIIDFIGMSSAVLGPDFADAGEPPIGWELYVAPIQPLACGFEDWEEWEEIVLSALRAKLKLEVPERTGLYDFRRQAFVRDFLMGGFQHGFTRDDWVGVFQFLETDGKVKFEDALAFFRNIDSKRENFKLRRIGLGPRRQSAMVCNWVGGNANHEFPSLCLMDNASAALVLAQHESVVFRSEALTKLLGATELPPEQMTGPNFSREKAKLGLVSCKKPLFKAEERGGKVKITQRR